MFILFCYIGNAKHSSIQLLFNSIGCLQRVPIFFVSLNSHSNSHRLSCFRLIALCEMGDDGGKAEGESDKKIVHVYPLVKHSDMIEEMRAEAIELSITACEKFAQNYEQAAKSIKDSMDKKFGTFWHVIVGEGFGFEVSYETKHILYLFFGGNLAVVVWKCS